MKLSDLPILIFDETNPDELSVRDPGNIALLKRVGLIVHNGHPKKIRPDTIKITNDGTRIARIEFVYNPELDLTMTVDASEVETPYYDALCLLFKEDTNLGDPVQQRWKDAYAILQDKGWV